MEVNLYYKVQTMSSYLVLAEVSKALKRMLWDAYSPDPTLNPQIVPTEQAIVFTNPTETLQSSANRLSLWLYRIEENEFVKNQPLRRVNTQPPNQPPNQSPRSLLGLPALTLDLSYLVTPLTGNADHDLRLLGKTMQVFADNAIVPLHNELDRLSEDLRIILGRISLEELTRIWEALNEPYRLSVCYRVRVTHIESERQISAVPIIDSNRGYGQSPNEQMQS